MGQNWQDDFQVTLHLQDELRNVSDTGNIFLTNKTKKSTPAGLLFYELQTTTLLDHYFSGPELVEWKR